MLNINSLHRDIIAVCSFVISVFGLESGGWRMQAVNLQSFCCSRVSVEDTLLSVMMIKDRIDEEDVDNVVMAIRYHNTSPWYLRTYHIILLLASSLW